MTDRRAVREGYDELAETYAARRSDDETLGVSLVEDLLADLPPDARLLDAGCGGGTPVLTRVGERAVGLDFSGKQLDLATANAPASPLVQGGNPDWLDSGAAMEWDIAGMAATREQLRSAGFELRELVEVDDTLADEDAQKPFFLAYLPGRCV